MLIPPSSSKTPLINSNIIANQTILFSQKRDGITSDGDGIHDDDSSSLSERQEKRSQRKKKFNARKFFRKVGNQNQEEVSLDLYAIMKYRVCINITMYEYTILTSLFELTNVAH